MLEMSALSAADAYLMPGAGYMKMFPREKIGSVMEMGFSLEAGARNKLGCENDSFGAFVCVFDYADGCL